MIPSFGKWEIVRGSTPSRTFQFTYDDDGTPRDVSADSIKFRAYADAGQTLLFPEKTGTSTTDTSEKIITLTASDTATPGAFYAELDRVSGAGAADRYVGTLVIGGPLG